MGLSLLNNIAVAIEAMKERHGPGRVAVIDWGMHHGNGCDRPVDRDARPHRRGNARPSGVHKAFPIGTKLARTHTVSAFEG